MFAMFNSATKFNQPSNVTDMDGIFGVAESFNQPLNNWNSNVWLAARGAELLISPLPLLRVLDYHIYTDKKSPSVRPRPNRSASIECAASLPRPPSAPGALNVK